MSLLAILDFTLVMKCFWLSCLGLCCPECCNCVVSALNGKINGYVYDCCEFMVSRGDSFVTTMFC
jgi:hypothetical protein